MNVLQEPLDRPLQNMIKGICGACILGSKCPAYCNLRAKHLCSDFMRQNFKQWFEGVPVTRMGTISSQGVARWRSRMCEKGTGATHPPLRVGMQDRSWRAQQTPA